MNGGVGQDLIDYESFPGQLEAVDPGAVLVYCPPRRPSQQSKNQRPRRENGEQDKEDADEIVSDGRGRRWWRREAATNSEGSKYRSVWPPT